MNKVINTGTAGALYPDKAKESKRQNSPKGKESFTKSEVAYDTAISVWAKEQQPTGNNQYAESKDNMDKLQEDMNKMLETLESMKSLDPEAIVLAAKQKLLSMMIKLARMLIATNYTSKSWLKLVDALKTALPISNMNPAKANLLDKAIGVMQSGLGGLEFVNPNEDESRVREQLPSELQYMSQSGGANVQASAGAAAPAAASVANVNISV